MTPRPRSISGRRSVGTVLTHTTTALGHKNHMSHYDQPSVPLLLHASPTRIRAPAYYLSAVFRAALTNTLKSVFGTGLLAMPWAFAELEKEGMLPHAIMICILLGVWSFYTMYLIYRCAALAWPVEAGYGELVTAALGQNGGIICSINLVLHQVMCVAAYLVFIGDNLQDVVDGTYRSSHFVLIAAIPIVCLCWLRDVRALGTASAIGTAALLLALCLVLHEGCGHAGTGAGSAADGPLLTAAAPLDTHRPMHKHSRLHTAPLASEKAPETSDEAAAYSAIGETDGRRLLRLALPAGRIDLAKLGSFVGITIFTFAGHSEVVPVALSLLEGGPRAHPRDVPYGLIVFLVAAVAIPIFLGFALVANHCFDGAPSRNILLSVHSNAAAILKALMAAAVVFTCPLKMFPAFEITEAALGLVGSRGAEVAPAPFEDTPATASPRSSMSSSRQPPGKDFEAVGSGRRTLLRNGQRTALVLLSVLLALECPDFEFLVAFIGAFCMGLIAYVLPPLMYCALLIRREELEDRAGSSRGATLVALLGHGVLFILGLLVLVGGTYQVLRAKLQL